MVAAKVAVVRGAEMAEEVTVAVRAAGGWVAARVVVG